MGSSKSLIAAISGIVMKATVISCGKLFTLNTSADDRTLPDVLQSSSGFLGAILGAAYGVQENYRS